MKTQPRKFFLAIRHRPSGGFLPAVKGFGFTRTEPTLEEPPRLFKRRADAQSALNYWLSGEHYEGAESDGPEGASIVAVRCFPKSNRKAELMEIVEIELTVRTLSDAMLRHL